MATADQHPITLVTNRPESYDSDDMKVIAEDGELKRVGKQLEVADVTNESIGMMRFNDVGAQKFVHKVETLMQAESTRARWYLSAIDELAADDLVGIEDITGLGWCEIDDANDLAHANRVVPSW